jgi:hypothetical protein
MFCKNCINSNTIMLANISRVMMISNSGKISSKSNSVKECGFYDLMVLIGLDEVDLYLAV